MIPLDMERISLYVPPEEYSAVKAAGGDWDDQSKRWYVPENGEPAAFSRWLEGGVGDEGYCIRVDEAFVAAAQVRCAKCRADIEVICLYGESGTDEEAGQTLRQFTVSNVWAMDEMLARQLLPWRHYREVIDNGLKAGYFANHCAQCDAVQEDFGLHSEPGDVFFGVARPEAEAVRFTRLSGFVKVSGDVSFGM